MSKTYRHSLARTHGEELVDIIYDEDLRTLKMNKIDKDTYKQLMNAKSY